MAKASIDFIDIQSGHPTSGTLRRVPASQADALLAYLRDLRDQHTSPTQAAGQAAEQTAIAAADSATPP